jgi:hypothetical protein
MNSPKQPTTPAPEDYPDALDGGEPLHHDDHRIGETQRQGPRSDEIDPSANQPRPDKPGREEAESGDTEGAA